MLKNQFSPDLYQYCLDVGVREHPLLQQLRMATLQLKQHHMLITPVQGALMALLAQINNCEHYLEIGMYTGYSSLWMAMATKNHATITTLDIDDNHLPLAQHFWQQAQVAHKIQPMIAPAIDSLVELIKQQKRYDLAFIDANKAAYLDYYELCMQLVRPGGLIILDNVLMYGQVLHQNPRKKYIKILQQLNHLIYADKRVEICLLPIADGMTIARKKDIL